MPVRQGLFARDIFDARFVASPPHDPAATKHPAISGQLQNELVWQRLARLQTKPGTSFRYVAHQAVVMSAPSRSRTITVTRLSDLRGFFLRFTVIRTFRSA
jgi:hypothetical protein